MTSRDLLEQARLLVERANADPTAVVGEAARLLGESRDPPVRSLALRAQGVAFRLLGDLPSSLRVLESAVETAEQAGLATIAASCRSTLAASRAYAGDFDAALADLELAAPDLDDREAARAIFQRGGVLQRMGRTRDALTAYDRALQALEAVDDALFAAHVLANRGLLLGYAGQITRAVADVEAARQRYETLDQPALAATMVNNLGFLATRSGDLLTALERFDQASRAYAALGMRDWVTAIDRCEALVAAGLVDEAADRAAAAAAVLAERGMHTDEAEALMLQAEAALAAGRLDEAREAARRAGDLFTGQDREGWVARARRVTLDADTRSGGPRLEHAEEGERLADALDRAGQSLAARSSRLLAARVRAGMGDVRAARRALSTAPAAGPVTTALELEEALTTAVVRLADGDRPGAAAAAHAGMVLLDRRRATLGSLDLRSHVALHGRELAALGLRLALDDGRPADVLRWMEWTRARALQFPSTAPPDDPELAALLVEERSVAADLADREREGRPVAAQLAALDRLREAVNRRARRQEGSASVPPVVSPEELAANVGARRLLEFAVLDGRVVAVALTGTDVGLWTGGTAAGVQDVLDRLALVLDRVALGGGDPAASGTLSRLLDRLDALLLDGRAADATPTVVVPSAALGSVPWAALPSLASAPVTVLPSAALLRAPARRHDADALLVAGPDLDHAAEEVHTLAGLYPGAAVRVGAEATVAEVLDRLGGARVAHLTCHGRFDSRQPLFSSLRLADGHLTLHDVARLRRAPETVVLSACHAATSAALPGDELLGLPGAFLAAGASTVVAASGLVPDATPTVDTMRRFHAALTGGASPGAALRVADPDDIAIPPSVRFTVFGSD